MRYFFAFISILFIGCRSTNLVFPLEMVLTADTVRLNEVINPEFMAMCGDHLAISSSKSDPMIYLYSTPSLEFENAFIRKGRGPNEIANFPMFCKDPGNDCMYIWGYTPVTIKKASLNDNSEPEYDREFRLGKYEAFNYMGILNDSIFLYYLPDDLRIRKYDLIDGDLLDEIKFKKDSHNESFFYSNRGMMDINAEKIVYSYIFQKRIDIFDIKTMKRTAQVKVDNPKLVQSFDFEDVSQCYTNVYAGKDRFYALYGGGNYDSNLTGSTLEVFDYDGKPLAKYGFDIMPYIFIVDEANNAIYGYNGVEAPDHLLKFKL